MYHNIVLIYCSANRTMPPGVTYSATQQQQRQPLQQLSGYGRSVHHDHRHAYSASGDHNDLNRQSSPERPQCNEMIAPRNIGNIICDKFIGLLCLEVPFNTYLQVIIGTR